MKKLVIYLVIISLAFATPANALIIAWDANTDNTLGYVLYWQEEGATEQFRVNLTGKENTQYIIEDKFLKISTTQNPAVYNVWAYAYGDQGISDSSEVITATRVYAFSPPASNLPTIIYEPTKPTKITINVTP